MCEHCFEHSKKAWYLEESNHTLGSQGLFNDIVNWKILDFLELSARMLFAPSGRIRIPRFLNGFFNQFAKLFHGGQILSRLEQAYEIIDATNDIGLSYCICKKAVFPQEDDFRCLLLNNFAGFMRRDHPEKIRFITKEDAKKFVRQKREQENCYQAVYWGANPNVSILCNCDQYCGSLVTPEIYWAQVPAIVNAAVIKPGDCINCGLCLSVCHIGAIARHNGRVVIDTAKCRGCGLCKDVCPTEGVIGFHLREYYYDPVAKKRIKRTE